jgi:hypothetical protein
MDWQRYNNKYVKLSTQLNHWSKEIADSTGFNAKLDKLKGEGASVPPEEQGLDLLRLVTYQANVSGLNNNGVTTRPSTPNTNSFFAENGVNLSFSAEEKSLVEFLFQIGNGNSIVRVAALTIRPDPQNFRLTGSATLIASYRKDLKKAAAAEAKKAAQSAATKAALSTNRPVERPKPAPVKLPNSK